MLKTKIQNVVSGVVCALFLGTNILALTVNAATTEILKFKQDLIITNSGTQTVSTPTEVYNYRLSPVTDPEILAVVPADSIGISAGVEKALVLTTTEIDFGTVECKAGETSLSKDIEMTINVDEFGVPGIYRYALENTTTDDLRYLDIYIVTDNGELCVEGYAFYLASDFRSGNFEKSVSFVDTKSVTPPENYDIVFRFVDDKGNSLAEDITFIETIDVLDVVPETSKDVSAQTGFGVHINYSIAASGATDAYSLYEETLKRITDRNYTVISDEIAAHGKTGFWRKTEQGQQSVYTVTFKANPEPTPPVTATGEGVSKGLAIGGICMIAGIGVILPVIILNRSKKTEDEVEGGQKK